jgi:hypothetical protein
MPMHTSPCSGASAEDWKNAMHTDNAQKRGKPFPLGNRSGKGRPVGSRNKTTLMLEQLLDGEGEAIFAPSGITLQSWPEVQRFVAVRGKSNAIVQSF